jgi:cathepsin E
LKINHNLITHLHRAVRDIKDVFSECGALRGSSDLAHLSPSMFIPLVTTLTLALVCAASPVIVHDNFVKLPIARRFNSTGTSKLVELDRIRAQALKTRIKTPRTKEAFKSAAQAALANVPVTNGVTIYTAEVHIL